MGSGILVEGGRPRQLGQRVQLGRDGALDGELDGLGRELLAVVELDPAAQL
jgi:hypothetical protein